MKITINPKYKSLENELKALPSRFESEGETLYDQRNTIKRFVVKDNKGAQYTLIVKRFGPMKPLQKLCYSTLFSSKAERAYKYAFRFLEQGIDTPEPIAYIEIKEGMLLSRCYVITTECSSSDCRFLRNDYKSTKSGDFIKHLAAFLARMHETGIMHGDLNLSNIIYKVENDSIPSFTVIDINRTKFYASPSRNKCLKCLMRLTHDRDLLDLIVGDYAEIRGWNKQECCAIAQNFLLSFERRKRFLHRLTGRRD